MSGLLDALVSARTVERPCASFRATWMERSGGVRDQPSSMQAPAAGHQATIHGALEADLGPEIDSECGDTPLAWWKRSRRVTISHRLEVRASASIHGSWGAASSPLHSMDMLPLFSVRAEAVVQPLCHAWHHHHFAVGGDVLREALGRVRVAQLPVSDLVAPVGLSRPEVEGSASVFLQVQQQADHARGQVMRLSGSPAPKPSGAGESGEGAPASAGAVAEPERTPRWVAKLSLPPPAPDASVTALNTLLGGKDKQLQRQMHSALHLPAALALVQQGTVSDEAETLSSETIATLTQAAGDLEDVVTAVDDALRQVREALGDSELNDSGSGGLCEAVAELARVVVDSAERKQRLGEVHAACEDARALAWDDVAPIARIASTVPLSGVAGSTGGAGVLRVFKESADTESGVEPLACALLSELDEVLDGVDWMEVLEPVGARRASPASITKGLCQVEVDASPGQGSGAAGLDEVAASLPDVSPLLSATQAAAVSLTAVLDASDAFSALQSGVSEMTTISREQLATLVGAVGDLGKLGIGFLRKVPVMLQLSQHTHSLAEVGLGHAVSRAVVARVADSLLSFILPTSAGFGAIVDDARGVAGLSGALAGDEVVTKVLTGSPKATDPVLPGVAAAEAQRVKRFKPKAENGEKDTTSDMNTEVEGGDEVAKEEEAVAGDDPIAQTLSVVTHLQGLLGVMAPAAKEDLQDVVRPVVTSLGDLATHTHAAHAALGKLWKPVCAACDVARPLCEGPRQGDEAAMERLVHLVEQPHEGVRPLTKCLEKSSEWQEELGAAVKELRPSLTALSRAAAALRPQLQATAQRLPNALSRAMRVLSIVLVHFEWIKSMGDKRTARVGLSASFDLRTEPSNGGSGGGAKGGALISVFEGTAGPSAAEVRRAARATSLLWGEEDAHWVSPARRAAEREALCVLAPQECEGTGEAMQGGPDTLRGGDIRVHPEILALLQTQEGAGLGAEDLPRVRASADFAASASVLSRDVEMLSVHMSPFVDAMGLHNALPQLRVMGIEVTEESLSDPKALLKSAGKALLQKSIEVATSPETLMLVLRKAAELISRTDRNLPLLTWLVRARDVEAAFGKEALERAAAEARPEADGVGPPRVVCNTSASAAEQSATPDCGISLGGVVMPAAATLLDLYDATAAAGSGEEGSPECASAAHSLQALLRVMGELLTGMGTLVDVAGKGALPPGVSLRALLDEAAEKEGHWYARLRTVADESQGIVLDAAGLFSATSGHHLATCVRVILADHIAEAKPIQDVVEAVEVLGGGIGQMASAMEDLVGALGGGDPSEMLALVGSDSPAPWMRNSVGGAKAIARGLRQLAFAADSVEALSPELTEQLRGAAERPVSHLVNAVQGAARSPAFRRAAASSGRLLAKVEMGAAVGRAVFGCVFGVVTRTTQAVRTLIEQNGDSTQQVATLKDALAEITAMEACKLPSRGPIRDLFEAAQRNSSAAGLSKVERGIVSAMKWINRAQSGLALALRLVERGVVLREIVLQVKGAVEGNGDARAAFKALDSGIAAVGATISDLRGFLVAMLGLPSHSQLARGLQVVSKAIAFFRSIAATVVTLVRSLLDGEVPLSPAGIADVGVRVLATVAGDKLREAELMQRAIRFPVGMAMLRSSNRLMPLGGLVASFPLPDGRSATPFTIVEAHHSAFFAPCMVSICYMAGEVNEYEDVAEETGVSEKHKATLASLCRGMQRGQRLLEFAYQGVFAVSETVATDDARDLYGTSPISSGTKVPDRERAGKMRQLEAKVRNLIELEGLDQDIEQVASLPSFAARFQQFDNEVVEYYRDSMRQFLQDSEAFDDTETEDSFVELKTRIRRQRSRNTGAAVGSPTGETADDEIELADEEGSLYVDSNRFRRTNVQPCRPCLQTAVAQLRRAADVFDAYANVATVALPTNEMISKDFEPKILGVTPLEEFPQRSISFLDAVDGMVGAVLDVADATEFNRTAGVRRLEVVRQGLHPARDSLQEGAMLVRCSQIVARAVDEIVARLATTLHESVVDVSTLVAALRTVVRDARLTFSKLHRGKCWGALQSPSTGLHSAAGMLAQGSGLGSAAADFVSSLGGLIQGVGGVVDALRKVRSPEQGVAVLYRFWKEHYPSLAKALGALEDGAKAVSATGSFRTQGSARVSEVAKEMQRLLLKFDQQVRRIASATAVLSNPRVGLEQLLSEGVVRPSLDLVELVTEEGAIRATLLGVSKEFLRSRDLPVVPALLGSSGGASTSMSTNRTTGQALELLELPAEEMAIGGSSLLAIARITAGSAMSVMHNLFCSGKLVLDCTKKLVLDIERRGYEGNDRLDIQDQLVSLFYIKFPAEVFAVYTSIRSIVEQLKELQQVSLEDDGDAYDRTFSALLSRLRQVAQDVERVAENQEKIHSQFSYAMYQLQSTLEDMDDRALQVAAGLAKLPEQMAVKEMMHVVADPIQLAFRLVNEVSGLFHGLTMLLHTPSVTTVNKLSTAMAALGATFVNDVPPQVKTLLDYRSAFSLECPQVAGPGELAAACDFVRKGPALDHFFTSGTARAAVEGLSSEVHELQAVATRLGAGISAVGMATEGTLGVGLRGIELVSELVYKSQRMTSVRTMLPVLASLSEDGRAIFEDGSGAIVEMWRNFQVAGLLRKEEAERMAESAAPLGQAAAKFRAGVELGLGVLRTALSGASFVETVKASRQEGSSDFARLEILASWEELRAQGTETLACGRRHDLLMELIPASKQGIVETLQSALCTALQKGRSVVEILASVASAEEGEMASVLLATVGQRALEGALSRLTDPDAALKSIVPRIAPTIAGADGSFLTALQNLLALRSTGVLNPSIVGCATSLSQVVGKAVKKAKRELRSPGLQQLDAALQGFEAAASIMVPIAGHHGISKLLAGRGTSSLWKIFVEKLEAPLAAASRHQTTFENLREAASALSPEDMVALTAALAKVQRGGTKADPPSGAEVVSLLRNVSDFAEGTLGAAQLFIDIARSLGSGSGQGVLSTFLGSEASRAAFSGQIPHSELIAAGISESVPAKLLDALEKALPALHALSTSLAGNTTVFGRWAAFAAETSTLCASIQHNPSPATAQATTLVDLADISVHGARKDDPLHAVFAPLQRRASGLPVLHIQGRMGAVVDPSRAFQTVLALQEVVTRSMLMAGEARAALAQPDSATTAEMLEALGETLPQRKDAASQVPLLDSKGLRIAGAVASAVGRQGPHLVASVRRLVSAAKGLSTGEGEDSPNAMFENTVATFEAVAAAPTVASAAMAVAAEAMDLFAAAHAAVNSKNPLAGVKALLDGWDKRVPALLQRLQKARKGLTGTSEKAVQFFERLVTMLGNVFRLVLRAQLKEPETSIVCKGGGSPLPVTLTDDKLMSKGPITLVSLPLGPFPVFGVPLTVTLSLMLRLEAALESGACRFTYMSGREEQYSAVSLPLTAEAMADARVAIGASMGGVGLGLRLSIVGLTLAPQLDVQPASGAACLQLVPIISTLSGEVYLFADLVVTEFRPTLFRWSGLKRRLPGPCESLKPAVFNTCPAVPMIDPSRGSDSLMQRLFFAGSRPPRIAAPTDVLDPSETTARGTAVLREVNQRGGAAAASQPVMLEQHQYLSSSLRLRKAVPRAAPRSERLDPEPRHGVEAEATSQSQCTICTVRTGFVYDSIACPTPVSRMHVLAGLPNVGDMVERALSSADVFKRGLGAKRARKRSHAIAVCEETVVEGEGTVRLGAAEGPARTLAYQALLAVQWNKESGLGTEWYGLRYDSARDDGPVLSVVDAATPPKEMRASAVMSRTPLHVQAAFDRAIAEEEKLRAVPAVGSLGAAERRALHIDVGPEEEHEPLPIDGARSVPVRYRLVIDPNRGWTVGRAGSGAPNTTQYNVSVLTVEAEPCARRLRVAEQNLALARNATGEAEEAGARGQLEAVQSECAESAAAGSAGAVTSSEAAYVASTRQCLRCNLAYNDFLSCPLEGARGEEAVQAARTALGERLAEGASRSLFWDAAARATVAQRCLAEAYLGKESKGGESTEEMVARATWRDLLHKSGMAMDLSLRVFVCDERVTEEGHYDGWLALQSTDTYYLHFRVPVNTSDEDSTACEPSLYTEDGLSKYQALRDRAVPQLLDSVVADAAAVDLARQECLPAADVAAEALAAMARSPTAFVPEARALASAPTGYEASQVPRCLPCTVSGKAAKLRVECAQDDEARQLRVQGALGEAAPSGDESAAGERTNAVLDAAASAALRAGLEGVEGIDGDGYTLAVCGETTWALDRDAAGSEGGGNGSIALLQVANDPARCTFECHRSTMGSLSHDPCGKSVEVSVREAPGCDKLREGVDVADKAPALRKAVLERCKSAASTCNSVHAVLKSVAGNGEDDSDPTAPRAGGVRAVRASAKTKGPNVCKFECRAKGRIYGSSPCGVTVKVAASAVPGCTGFLKEAGVGPAEGQAAVKAQCAVAAAEAGATCNADYSTFLRAVTQDDAPEPVPRSCTFHCHAAAGWAPFSKPTPCGKQVTFSEASAPGCSSLEAGAHVPTHMTWLSEVTSACQNADGACTEKSVATVASVQSLSGDAAEEAEGDGSGAGECLLACEHKPVVGFAKSCGVTVAVPERMAPGCTATKFGERIKSDAVGRLCKAHAPESESCDRPRGRFIGMSDAPAPELMGGVVCVGKGGQTSCVKYVADYAPLPTMVDDGQAQVVARPLQPNEPVAGGFLYAFDKLTASIVYGEKAHADYRIKDTCPAVPAPNSET